MDVRWGLRHTTQLRSNQLTFEHQCCMGWDAYAGCHHSADAKILTLWRYLIKGTRMFSRALNMARQIISPKFAIAYLAFKLTREWIDSFCKQSVKKIYKGHNLGLCDILFAKVDITGLLIWRKGPKVKRCLNLEINWCNDQFEVFCHDTCTSVKMYNRPNTKGVAEYRDFEPIERYISETVQDRS